MIIICFPSFCYSSLYLMCVCVSGRGGNSCLFSAFLGGCWSGLSCPHLGLEYVTKCLKDLTHPLGHWVLSPLIFREGNWWGWVIVATASWWACCKFSCLDSRRHLILALHEHRSFISLTLFSFLFVVITFLIFLLSTEEFISFAYNWTMLIAALLPFLGIKHVRTKKN